MRQIVNSRSSNGSTPNFAPVRSQNSRLNRKKNAAEIIDVLQALKKSTNANAKSGATLCGRPVLRDLFAHRGIDNDGPGRLRSPAEFRAACFRLERPQPRRQKRA